MPSFKPLLLAHGAVALAVLGLFFWGLQFLTIPKVFLLIRQPYALFAYQGPLLIALTILLAWFRERVAHALIRLCLETHRLVTAIAMTIVIGAEGVLHVFGIPHPECWWLSLFGSGAIATVTTAAIQKWRAKSRRPHDGTQP